MNICIVVARVHHSALREDRVGRVRALCALRELLLLVILYCNYNYNYSYNYNYNDNYNYCYYG